MVVCGRQMGLLSRCKFFFKSTVILQFYFLKHRGSANDFASFFSVPRLCIFFKVPPLPIWRSPKACRQWQGVSKQEAPTCCCLSALCSIPCCSQTVNSAFGAEPTYCCHSLTARLVSLLPGSPFSIPPIFLFHLLIWFSIQHPLRVIPAANFRF